MKEKSPFNEGNPNSKYGNDQCVFLCLDIILKQKWISSNINNMGIIRYNQIEKASINIIHPSKVYKTGAKLGSWCIPKIELILFPYLACTCTNHSPIIRWQWDRYGQD